jgi:endonuclease YncB( thermonuclease family)
VMESTLYHYRGIVRRVIDGDTIVVDLDLGLRVWMHDQVIRFFEVDAPELKTVEGQQAKAWLVEQLPAGAEVLVHTIRDRTEKYGRWLGRVRIGNRDLHSELVAKWPAP